MNRIYPKIIGLPNKKVFLWKFDFWKYFYTMPTHLFQAKYYFDDLNHSPNRLPGASFIDRWVEKGRHRKRRLIWCLHLCSFVLMARGSHQDREKVFPNMLIHPFFHFSAICVPPLLPSNSLSCLHSLEQAINTWGINIRVLHHRNLC